jgi:spermidine/putrescine transport system substrate-binding protein
MCRPDIAIRNMDEIGYVSVIASPEVLEAQSDDELTETVDASYFFGEGAEAVKLNPVQYPDKTVIERCAMMHDSGARTPKMLEMWARIKGDNVSPWILAIIAISFGGLFIIGIRRKIKQMRRNAAKQNRRRKRKA